MIRPESADAEREHGKAAQCRGDAHRNEDGRKVGFEHFSYTGQHAQLKTLADYVIDRFYPTCREATQPYAALLEAVSERTAHLMAAWQAVGFCHGVMNTDNMSILGLTMDYGPFQFLDAFDPGHICNHSDAQGRYAYNRQPNMAYWNLFCLGQALPPLIGEQELALAALEPYKPSSPRPCTPACAASWAWRTSGPRTRPWWTTASSCWPPARPTTASSGGA